MIRSAEISHCGEFRYRLKRVWGEGKPLVFVMLNPSTADANIDDATIRRCIGFAKSHGFNAIDVVNLFAYRATKPSELRLAGYPVGELNDQHIQGAVGSGGKVIVAWGDNGRGLNRSDAVLRLIRSLGVQPYALKITKKGIPSHPLMLRSDCKLQIF